MPKPLLVFVHGWSVTSTGTYGELPARLQAEAARAGGPGLDIAHVYLGQYVSFRDEVRVEDVARLRGCGKLTLEVLDGNASAIASYRRFGFETYALDPAFGRAQFWQKKL